MNQSIPHITKVTPMPGYRLHLQFEDGVKGTVDLSNWKGKGVFVFWNDVQNFHQVKITNDKKLQWNEDIDMDPDAFYLQIIDKTFDEYARDKQFLWHYD